MIITFTVTAVIEIATKEILTVTIANIFNKTIIILIIKILAIRKDDIEDMKIDK